MKPVDVIPPIRRDDDHELRVIDAGERGIVLQVWARIHGTWQPSRRFFLAVRRSELPRVLEALTLANGNRAPSSR
jgi:hypothetical protein